LEAVGVSGGPDSMALCALSAGWKSDGLAKRDDVSGFVDGLLGIVVDHRLRPESSDEAKMVLERVNKMGKKWNCAQMHLSCYVGFYFYH
jgi:tRNA(Ile)-lysidine synthase